MPQRIRSCERWSDAELVAACRTGDPRAWRALVGRHRRLVFGVPRMLGLQVADAEEVFQQVFVQLHRSLSRLREDERVAAWLTTTARRASLRLLREARRRRKVGEAVLHEQRADATTPEADVELERLQERERLRAVLASLDEPCRSLLLWTMADPPVPYREMARRLDRAVGSLGSLRSRCLGRLRQRLRAATVRSDVKRATPHWSNPTLLARALRPRARVGALAEAHARSCPRCAADLASLEALVSAVRRSDEEPAPGVLDRAFALVGPAPPARRAISTFELARLLVDSEQADSGLGMRAPLGDRERVWRTTRADVDVRLTPPGPGSPAMLLGQVLPRGRRRNPSESGWVWLLEPGRRAVRSELSAEGEFTLPAPERRHWRLAIEWGALRMRLES